MQDAAKFDFELKIFVNAKQFQALKIIYLKLVTTLCYDFKNGLSMALFAG